MRDSIQYEIRSFREQRDQQPPIWPTGESEPKPSRLHRFSCGSGSGAAKQRAARRHRRHDEKPEENVRWDFRRNVNADPRPKRQNWKNTDEKNFGAKTHFNIKLLCVCTTRIIYAF